VLIQNFNFKDVLRLLANGAGDDTIAGKKKKKKTKRGTLRKAPIKATQPIEEDESWESVFTIKHSPTQPLVVPIPRPSSKLKMINPCKWYVLYTYLTLINIIDFSAVMISQQRKIASMIIAPDVAVLNMTPCVTPTGQGSATPPTLSMKL
jgi:hypothetical protein